MRDLAGIQKSAKLWSTKSRERTLASGGQKFLLLKLDLFQKKLRCVAKCACGGSPKGAYFDVQETPVSAAAQSTSVNSKFSGSSVDSEVVQ